MNYHWYWGLVVTMQNHCPVDITTMINLCKMEGNWNTILFNVNSDFTRDLQ